MPRFSGLRQYTQMFELRCCKSQTMATNPKSVIQAPRGFWGNLRGLLQAVTLD